MQMSKHLKQTDGMDARKARTHLQQSWRRWLEGKAEDSSSSLEQVAANPGSQRMHQGERDIPTLLGLPNAWNLTKCAPGVGMAAVHVTCSHAKKQKHAASLEQVFA